MNHHQAFPLRARFWLCRRAFALAAGILGGWGGADLYHWKATIRSFCQRAGSLWRRAVRCSHLPCDPPAARPPNSQGVRLRATTRAQQTTKKGAGEIPPAPFFIKASASYGDASFAQQRLTCGHFWPAACPSDSRRSGMEQAPLPLRPVASFTALVHSPQAHPEYGGSPAVEWPARPCFASFNRDHSRPPRGTAPTTATSFSWRCFPFTQPRNAGLQIGSARQRRPSVPLRISLKASH